LVLINDSPDSKTRFSEFQEAKEKVGQKLVKFAIETGREFRKAEVEFTEIESEDSEMGEEGMKSEMGGGMEEGEAEMEEMDGEMKPEEEGEAEMNEDEVIQEEMDENMESENEENMGQPDVIEGSSNIEEFTTITWTKMGRGFQDAKKSSAKSEEKDRMRRNLRRIRRGQKRQKNLQKHLKRITGKDVTGKDKQEKNQQENQLMASEEANSENNSENNSQNQLESQYMVGSTAAKTPAKKFFSMPNKGSFFKGKRERKGARELDVMMEEFQLDEEDRQWDNPEWGKYSDEIVGEELAGSLLFHYVYFYGMCNDWTLGSDWSDKIDPESIADILG